MRKMTSLMKLALNVSALTTVGYSGWYIGKYQVQNQYFNTKNDNQVTDSESIIVRKPGLPLFATVSAAVPLDTDQHETSTHLTKGNRIAEIMKYGFPGLDHVRSYDNYVLSYDRRNRVAHWVFEHINKSRLQPNKEISRATCEFKPDPSIHQFFRSENADYKRSGFDRGHLAAAGNHKVDQRHLEQTFFLTNMAPQVGVGFNRDSWNRLEKHVRNLTNTYKEVYVCTGPLYLPRKEADGKKYVRYQVIGANNVAVPTHFYKVIVMETYNNSLEMEAYVMPNTPIDDNTPLTNFQVPPESIERAAGLLFFDKISRDQLKRINGKGI